MALYVWSENVKKLSSEYAEQSRRENAEKFLYPAFISNPKYVVIFRSNLKIFASKNKKVATYKQTHTTILVLVQDSALW